MLNQIWKEKRVNKIEQNNPISGDQDSQIWK